MKDKIIVKGARVHNLKNVSLEIPRDKLIVFTGLSGSGKSSLAFDTLYAEGQRRYVESLSAYLLCPSAYNVSNAKEDMLSLYQHMQDNF